MGSPWSEWASTLTSLPPSQFSGGLLPSKLAHGKELQLTQGSQPRLCLQVGTRTGDKTTGFSGTGLDTCSSLGLQGWGVEGSDGNKDPQVSEKTVLSEGGGPCEACLPIMLSSPEGFAWSIMTLATNSINSNSCSVANG